MPACTPESAPAGPPAIRLAAEIAPDRLVSAAAAEPAATVSAEGLEWRFDEAALAAARERADEAAAREAEEAAVLEGAPAAPPAESEAAFIPLTNDLSAWYADATIFAGLVIGELALAAARFAVGKRAQSS